MPADHKKTGRPASLLKEVEESNNINILQIRVQARSFYPKEEEEEQYNDQKLESISNVAFRPGNSLARCMRCPTD
jgi:hypothetical protein